MPQEPTDARAVARAAYAAINAGDIEGFAAVVHPEVEFTSLVAEAEGTTYRGHEGLRAWWENVANQFDDVHWDLLEVRTAGERGLLRIRMSGVLSGVPLEQTMWQAVRVRDGKAAWWAFFRTEEEALAAAGLPEQPSP
jgi:ketosteroid isomerase-like protein